MPGSCELYCSIAFVSLSHVAGLAWAATMLHFLFPVKVVWTSEILMPKIGATNAATFAGFKICV